jgi:stage II sporulation protein D
VTPLLLALAVAGTPLEVRVLEAEHPLVLLVTSGAATCDGEALPAGPLQVSVGEQALLAGPARCAEVTLSQASFQLAPQGPARRYPGVLRVVREGAWLRLVDVVELEDYVAQAVQTAWPVAPPAALEAQAVVARTFALASLRRHAAHGFQLCDTTHCQVYGGAPAEAAASGAAARTQGQVLLAGGVALRPTLAHAACGGHTSRAEDVFGEPGAGLDVEDLEKGAPRCADAPDFRWERSVERTALGPESELQAVEVLRRDAGGRVLEVRVLGRRMTGEALRAWLAALPEGVELPSARFTVIASEGEVRFTGTGQGHGVGLCQAGAAALAQRHLGVAEILKRYFPGARLSGPTP